MLKINDCNFEITLTVLFFGGVLLLTVLEVVKTMIVNLKNPATNQFKQVKAGFSWTMFFFGFWVPLFRGDWKWLIIMLLLDIIGLFTFGIVTGVANIVMSFLYNKLYIQDLISSGYKPTDKASVNILQQKNIAFAGMVEG